MRRLRKNRKGKGENGVVKQEILIQEIRTKIKVRSSFERTG